MDISRASQTRGDTRFLPSTVPGPLKHVELWPFWQFLVLSASILHIVGI